MTSLEWRFKNDVPRMTSRNGVKRPRCEGSQIRALKCALLAPTMHVFAMTSIDRCALGFASCGMVDIVRIADDKPERFRVHRIYIESLDSIIESIEAIEST